MEQKTEKLRLWQERLAQADAAFSVETARMEEREQIYAGRPDLIPLTPYDCHGDGSPKRTAHVRNIVFENVETQVSPAIPQPKVTPIRKQDEHLAQVIENFLRNELNRLPFEQLNDLAERTVPIQGGVGYLVEWDNGAGSHQAIGNITVSVIHPRQLAPQPGIYTGLTDMDWFIVKLPSTREAVQRKYGVSLEQASYESLIGDGLTDAYDSDAVTVCLGFARNGQGGIDRYAWANDTELEDLENYQARQMIVCRRCGRPVHNKDGVCPWCGAQGSVPAEEPFEELYLPIHTAAGKYIPGASFQQDENGKSVLVPTCVPFYRPDVFPLVFQKSVSVYGKLLGNSDVDMIADQQNTINRLEQKIIDRLIKAGSRITLPDRADIRIDPEDSEKIYIGNAADKALIGMYDFKGDLQYELAYLATVYEEARQILGITDSFQGRRDSTATSGKAKEFAAAQSAGRLESKRIMKHAAYATVFEIMFKFALAYSDEPRPVSYKDFKGQTQYEEFNRYDFLEQDEDGQWYWNDQFLFSIDNATPLSSNREAMWQETRQNLQTGAFGDPSQTETLILFWQKMEDLHYPGAAVTRQFLEQKREEEQHSQKEKHPAERLSGEIAAAVERKAREDARAASEMGRMKGGA